MSEIPTQIFLDLYLLTLQFHRKPLWKRLANPVAGQANALVVPDIVSGNILFKALVWCAGGLAAGLVAGGAVPIVLTSRSDPPEARLAAIALASLD